MPVFSRVVPGNFCWVEGNLEDPARGKSFYGALFGWGAKDMPMPGGTYSMMTLGENQVAGLLTLPENAKKMGAPPHWLNYIGTEDVKAKASKAESLGGRVLLAPKSVGPGIMSVIQDPTGGVFALWSSQESMGGFVWGESNALCWAELTTTDPAAALAFYTGLFGWKVETMSMGPGFDYHVVKNGGENGIGGIMAQPQAMKDGGAPSAWTSYFAVDDCDKVAKHATELGAGLIMPPTDIPNIGRFAIVRDPQGAVFAIIKGEPS